MSLLQRLIAQGRKANAYVKAIAACYAWGEAAQQAVGDAQKAIADRCGELGIPSEFQPTLGGAYFIERGENAWKNRRKELRRGAKAEIDAVNRAAQVEIEQISIEAQTQIIAHGPESAAAKTFLDQLPTVEELMPSIGCRR
jgi:hypothetical protein